MNLINSMTSKGFRFGNLSSGVNVLKTQASCAFEQISSQYTARANQLDGAVLALSQSSELLSGEIDILEDYSSELVDIDSQVANNLYDTLTSEVVNLKSITTEEGEIINFTVNEQAKTIYTNGELWLDVNQSKFNHYAKSLSGRAIPNDLVLKQLTTDSEMCTLLVALSDDIRNSDDANLAVMTTVNKFSNSKFSAVRDLTAQVKSGYQSGGTYGVLQVIKTLFSATATLQDNGDGTFSFTDNDVNIPRAWGVGIGTVIYTTVSVAIATIATIVSPVLGLVAGAVSLLGKYFVDKYNETYMDEYPCLTIDSDRIFPFTPYAPWQTETYYLQDTCPTEVRQAMSQLGIMFGYYKTYGGYMVYGVTEYNSNGTPYKIGLEFHPDLVDRVARSRIVWNQIRQLGKFVYSRRSVVIYTDNATEYRRVTFDLTLVGNNAIIIKPYLDQAMTDETGSVFTPDSSGSTAGYLTNDIEINRLERVISANYFLFICSQALQASADIALLVGYDSTTNANAYIALWSFLGNLRSSFTNLFVRFLDYSSVGPYTYDLNLWSWEYQGSTVTRTLSIGNKTQIPAYAMQEVASDVKYAAIAEDSAFFITNDTKPYVLSDIFYYNPKFSFCMNSPKYTRGSVLSALISFGVLIITVAVTVCVASFQVKNFLAMKRAQSAAKVANAWNTFQNDPTAVNYQAYRKTAKQNNRLVSVIGGTKYDVDDYWFGDQYSSTTGAGESRAMIQIGNVADEVNAVKRLIKPE